MTLNSMALRYDAEKLFILDQQLLPFEKKWIEITSVEQMITVIKALKVRGAPLIGVAAALSLADELKKLKYSEKDFIVAAERMRAARPTAVNLMNAVDRLKEAVKNKNHIESVWNEALAIFNEDVELCKKMGRRAAELISDGDGVLTHCNTGGLATVGLGTALAGISTAWAQKKNIHVYVDETRPLLQGARLTTWELTELKIPHTLICDNMAGWVMSQGHVQKVFVGTDRIAMNGDFANKVGTYTVAVMCKYHGIPFYVVGPSTTIDRHCPNGKAIPIEQRAAEEVRGAAGSFGAVQWTAGTSDVYNPAFDVTPVELVTGIVVDDQLLSQAELKAGELKRFLS